MPDERIDSKERDLIAMGRQLEARVAIHGEWIDTAEDRILPVEDLLDWDAEPQRGFRERAVWIDPAYTAQTSSCETAIAVAGRSHDGGRYLIECVAGR